MYCLEDYRMTPSERINDILEMEGLSCSAFANHINEPEWKLKDIIRGKTKGISNTIAKKIVDNFPSISMRWLITGEGEMQSPQKYITMKSEKIEQMIEYYANGNKSKFAKRLGIKPQSVQAWIMRDTYNAELIFSKCEGINAEWLLSSDMSLPMLKSKESNNELNDDLKEQVQRLRRTEDFLYSRIKELEAELSEYRNQKRLATS